MNLVQRCRMRVAVTCVAVTIAALAPASAYEPLARDPRLDRSLSELLACPVDASHDAVDAAIQHTLAQCRHRGITGVGRSTAFTPAESTDGSRASDPASAAAADVPPSDVAFCHRVRFVRHVRERHRAREAAIHARAMAIKADEADEGDESEGEGTLHAAPAAVALRSVDDIDYQTMFETFAERSTPLVLLPTPASLLRELGLSTANDVASFTQACFDRRARPAPLRIDDDACVPWLDQFHVPLITVNNFLPRTRVATNTMLLPSLLTIAEAARDASSMAHVTCPFGLHTVLVPVHGSVEYRLYDAQFAPVAWSLRPDDDDSSDAVYSERSVSIDGTVHHSSNAADRDAAFLVEAAVTDMLDVGHTLFVPGDKYVPVLRGASQVLRFCFVDASNLNHVTETLRVDALVDRVAAPLFRALQSPTFDTSMTRRPSLSDTLWANYMLWPKETKLLKRRDMVSTETVVGGRDQPVPMSRRERLKLWQDDKRWERRVRSLTLPVPLPPVVVNTTRTSVTLRWQDLYEPPKNDITAFGYEVRWRREQDGRLAPSESSESSEQAMGEHDAVSDVRSGAVNFTHAQFVRSAMPTTLFGDEFDGKDMEGVVRGLDAEATYSFTVRIFVGDNVGVESERSRSASTASSSVPARVAGVVTAVNASGTCVDVRWLASSDDGGRRITSYVFALRYIDSPLAALQGMDRPEHHGTDERLAVLHMPASTATTAKPSRPAGGTWLFGSVCDQIPGQSQVRVAAVNAIGVSPWSTRSEPMAMGTDTPRVIPTVYGRGDPAFLSSPSSLLHGTRPANATSNRPRVLLSDVLQQIVVAAPGATTESRFEVWAGHFSPRRFHVSSELVLADPLDGSQPLRNAADVRDRVVVVARSGSSSVPFLFKLRHVQQAGALGVVFADVDDRCARGFDQSCVPGATKRQGQGFGASDRHPLWRDIRIPFVLAQAEPSARLLALLSG